jgi:hypothetical protein
LGSIRTVTLSGVKGVKLLVGKLKASDREYNRHEPGTMVQQTVIFSKAEWPEFRKALEWQRDHFTSLDNPRRKRTASVCVKCGAPATVGMFSSRALCGPCAKAEGRRLPNQPGGAFKPGDRVALHAATSEWMQGDRYGTVVRLGRAKLYLDKATGATVSVRPVYVKLDSGRTRRFHPDNLFLENPNDLPPLTQLNSGEWVLSRSGGGARTFTNRKQAEAARAKVGDRFDIYQPRLGPVFYVRLKLKDFPITTLDDPDHAAKQAELVRRLTGRRRLENPGSSYTGGHSAVGIKIPSPFSSKASIRWSDGSLSRIRLGEAIELLGTSRVQDALDRPGKWIVVGQLTRDNPPRGSIPQIERAYNDGYNDGRIDKSIGHKSTYSYLSEAEDSLEHSDPRVRWRAAHNMGYRDGWDGRPRRRDFGPETGPAPKLPNPPASHWFDSTEVDTWFERDRAHVELRWADTGETIIEWWDEDVAQAVEDGFLDPRDYHTSALEYAEQIGALADSVRRRRTARGVERSKARPNPSGNGKASAAAVRMFQEIHGGKRPTGFRLKTIPDLGELVMLGNVRAIDYQLEPHVARGSRNTPYRHAFGRGSMLLTDPTGKALVIVGNLKVSRGAGGRYGYIRAASGG